MLTSADIEQVASAVILESASLPTGAWVGGTLSECPRGRRPSLFEQKLYDIERQEGGCPRSIALLPCLEEATCRLRRALSGDADA